MSFISRWAKENPLEFSSAKAFVEFFKNQEDPVLAVSRKRADEEEKIAWTLLGTAIFQGISYPNFQTLFQTLSARFSGEALWAFPLPKEKEFSEILNASLGKSSWELKKNLPGIFLSTGHFVRRHFPLSSWLLNHSVNELWRDLGEIYFMGKSASRPKVCAALYRLTSPNPLGLGFSIKDSPLKLPLPLSMGARRYFSFLGPARALRFSEMEKKEKQNLANEFFSVLSPELPFAPSHAFQFFWENGKTEFLCREKTSSCVQCPFQNTCPKVSPLKKGE